MGLNNINSKSTWGQAASDINTNFTTIDSDLKKVKNATTRNKGYFSTSSELISAFPTASKGDIAYVGSSYPYDIWKWNGGSWAKSGSTGGEESVNLGNYYTKVETDEKFTEADAKLSELGSKEEHLEKKMSGVLWDAQAKNNDILFTSEDVRVGDSIILETDQLYAGGGVAFVDINGSNIVVKSFDNYTLRETVITENFSFAKVIWGGNFQSLKITNKDAASPLLRRLLDFKGSEMMGEYTETAVYNVDSYGVLGNHIRKGDLVYIIPYDTSKDSRIVISADRNATIGQLIDAQKWTVASIDASYIRDNAGLNDTFTITIKRRNSDILNYIDKLFDISESDWITPTQLQPDVYYDTSGILGTSVGFCVSTDIELSKGDLIVLISVSDNGMSSIVKKLEGAIIPVSLGKSYKHELYYWKADEDCAVRFSYSRNTQGQNYKIIKSSITNDLDSLKDTMKNVPIMVDSIGKNLFNTEEIIDGFYISASGGRLSYNATSAVSGIIPVSPGDEYYIYRPINIGTAVIRCLDVDGNQLKPLVLVNGEFVEDADWEPPTRSIAVKIPDGAIGLQFTCKFAGKECGYDSTQVELGTSFTGYEPYTKRKIISNDNLPELTNTEFVNIANSDKIGFFSNSFLNGYCMLGKHAINNLSMFSDYIMYNFGHSGDNALECLNRINNNETWLGDIPVQNWGIKYGVIAMQDNDGGLYNANSETYYYNFKKLANAVKSMGGIPILGTEHDSNYYYYNLARLSREEGYMFMNWGKTASKLYNSVFKPFWYNSHPATRTAWMWTYGMKPYIDSLPRPQKSIKLFRVRPSIDTSDLENLIYDDFPSRASIYEELTCGVSGLTESTESYFDRLDSSNTSYTTYKDEYQTLQARNNVNFGQYALVEVVSPYDCNNLNKIIAKIQGSGITNVYIKKNNSLDSPLPSDEKVAFGITSGTLSVGQEFQVTGGVFNNNILGTYIVEGIINGVVITTTSSSGKTTSGTDNPTTNISGVVLKGSYTYPSSEYMNRYHKPLGEWVSVDYSEEIDLSKYIKNCMKFDKMSLLLEGNNILISDIKFEIEGSGFYKENHPINRVTEERKGISLLTKSTFNSDDTEWSGISGVETYTPVKSTVNEEYEPLPLGIDTVRQLKEGQKVSQVLLSSNIDETDSFNVMLQIRIIARYFPEYVNNDSKWATSRIKRGSYDCEKLSIMIGNSESDTNPTKVASINVGLWWNDFIIDVPYFKGDTLMIVAEGDDIQLAKCDVVPL